MRRAAGAFELAMPRHKKAKRVWLSFLVFTLGVSFPLSPISERCGLPMPQTQQYGLARRPHHPD